MEYYSRFFDTVEINTTFYRLPGHGMARAWARKAPGGFEFLGEVIKRDTIWVFGDRALSWARDRPNFNL